MDYLAENSQFPQTLYPKNTDYSTNIGVGEVPQSVGNVWMSND